MLGTAQILWILLKLELWSMNTDQDETISSILSMKLPDVEQRPNTVYIIERPEVEQHNLPLQSLHGKRLSIQPALDF